MLLLLHLLVRVQEFRVVQVDDVIGHLVQVESTRRTQDSYVIPQVERISVKRQYTLITLNVFSVV